MQLITLKWNDDPEGIAQATPGTFEHGLPFDGWYIIGTMGSSADGIAAIVVAREDTGAGKPQPISMLFSAIRALQGLAASMVKTAEFRDDEDNNGT